MRIVTSVSRMQQVALAWRRQGLRVGFVPTMGYLHEGHLSLVREARRRVGERGVVVVSVFVNPAQFAPTEDLSRYPRNLSRDRGLCLDAGVDVLFVPPQEGMYPGGLGVAHSTFVQEERLAQGLEGASRPTHFRGVATVVVKLFNLVMPEVAVFGAKDYQQAAVVRRMVRDLNFPVRLVVAPTVREADGLAMSSRNQYLSPEERVQATVLCAMIRLVRSRVRRSARGVPAGVLRSTVELEVARRPAARLDYVEFVDPLTLEPVARVVRGTQMALAVFVGQTRLIDNGRL